MAPLNLDLNKRYTYADYLTWADDVRRELFDGFIKFYSPIFLLFATFRSWMTGVAWAHLIW
jgi:hypothetical protein